MTFFKNKPFHLMLALILTCTIAKTTHANLDFIFMDKRFKSPTETEVVKLGNKDALFLEKSIYGGWPLMECESPSHCREVREIEDVDLAHRPLLVNDIPVAVANYCQQLGDGDLSDDFLCGAFKLSRELGLSKIDSLTWFYLAIF